MFYTYILENSPIPDKVAEVYREFVAEVKHRLASKVKLGGMNGG